VVINGLSPGKWPSVCRDIKFHGEIMADKEELSAYLRLLCNAMQK